MTFHVGQQVVCVDDDFCAVYQRENPHVRPNLPRLGSVYTIRGVDDFKFLNTIETCLYLEEVVNPVIRWADGNVAEIGFGIRRFRPVKETDISIFTAMLAPTPTQKVRA